ncbi:M23 family metallopeptidase [Oscillospiraceae bacterium OttesenSCG-928-G22]|nr:M23 family metallopeptidase [Oscillospiraceae bacterium OttesenSCG-928-G22]
MYMHASTVHIKKGDSIAIGQIIGQEGKTGTGESHVHLEIVQGRKSSGYRSLNDLKLESLSPYDFIK